MNFRILAVLLASLTLAACDCGNPPVPPAGGGAGGGDPATGGGAGGGGGGRPPFVFDGGLSFDAGLTDPLDPNNRFKDTDCDGISDEEEYSAVYPGGRRTDPLKADSDGDGVIDGVEAGKVSSPAAGCSFTGDADPATKTNPTATDTDGDALDDALEDRNANGKLDASETDPGAPDTDKDGLDDGVEDQNRNGLRDSGETDPTLRDSDGDFIGDGLELAVTHTDPLKADSDGDSCTDSAEDFNQNGAVDPGETNPLVGTDCGPANNPDTDLDGIPNRIEDQNQNGVVDASETNPLVADTDGDGLLDGIEDQNRNGQREPGETNPLLRDSDCDGLLDGPTQGSIRGEDQNANGTVDSGETDPRRADTDGDGLSDGVESGLQTVNIADPGACTGVAVDADPTTTTSPTNPDSDGDQINDGAEDANQNGRVDPGELNPSDPSNGLLPDGGLAPAGAACTVMNLRPVLFKADGTPDVQLGLPAGFTQTATMTVGATSRGLMGFDPTTNVAFIAWKQAAPTGSTGPVEDEAAIQPQLAATGALTNGTTQTFTTWDGLPAVQGFYDMTSAQDVKGAANAIANRLVGPGAGVLTGSAAATGPFKIQAEYLHRSPEALVVVIAITPLTNYSGQPLFTMSDTAGGSALAQFGDANAYQCEVFAASSGKVDFLFVVDDSCSMATYQSALADTASAFATQLNNSTLDWRVALVTSAYAYETGAGNRNAIRGFTRDINQFRSWLTENSTCSGGVCSNVSGATPACWGQGANNGCWVGIGGPSPEQVLDSAARAVTVLTPVPDAGVPDEIFKIRNGAQVAIVLLADADDQSAYTGPQFASFFGAAGQTLGTGPSQRVNRLGPIVVHGIICPEGQTCGETQQNPRRSPAVIVARGGVRGDVRSSASITATVQQIINSTIGFAGYRLQKPPIGASVKVALDAVSAPASCNKNDIPRSRLNGFDVDGINRSLTFFGACRPGALSSQAAVSYRYWIDTTPDPKGNPPPCATDTFFDINEIDFCQGTLTCNRTTNACECPADCGGATPPAGKVCDTNRLVCNFICTSDCGGRCSPYQVCDTNSCSCGCRQNATCPAGFRFESSASTCGCVCDTSALNCGSTYEANASTCSCVCKADCGGCPSGTTCNRSTCSCSGGIN